MRPLPGTVLALATVAVVLLTLTAVASPPRLASREDPAETGQRPPGHDSSDCLRQEEGHAEAAPEAGRRTEKAEAYPPSSRDRELDEFVLFPRSILGGNLLYPDETDCGTADDPYGNCI